MATGSPWNVPYYINFVLYFQSLSAFHLKIVCSKQNSIGCFFQLDKYFDKKETKEVQAVVGITPTLFSIFKKKL